MLIPLGTDRPLRRPTVVTHALVALNVAAYVALSAFERLEPQAAGEAYRALMLDPRHPAPWGWLTYAFLHADFWHILGNMVVLWVFGPNVEDRFGRLGFLVFYLAGAAGAAGLHCLFENGPVIGASGAISAVTGAYLVLFPRTQVRCLFLLFISFVVIPAWWFIGFAIAWDLLLQGRAAHDGVARLAHLGGYAFGMLVSMFLLWRRILSREPYDLFTIGRQAYRRRQIREAAVRREDAQRRQAARAQEIDDQTAALAEARAAVAALASGQDLAGAARRYRELVERHADVRGATTLPRHHQLDIANHFFAMQDHQGAAYAYERFLEAYEKDHEVPRVRLMLGLINVRYLNDPVRARQLLADLPPLLRDPEQRRLAELLVEELG
jgi:membrane associated rhomboid family serine protease